MAYLLAEAIEEDVLLVVLVKSLAHACTHLTADVGGPQSGSGAASGYETAQGKLMVSTRELISQLVVGRGRYRCSTQSVDD